MKGSTTIKKKAIADIVDIRFGLYAQPQASGTVAYLQVRQFSEDGKQIIGSEGFITAGEASGHILQAGDVLFVGKGSRLFASLFQPNEQRAVASSVFFVLRPNTRLVDSEYLAAILNTPQSKAALLQLGSGTNIHSIRKSELGAFEIPLPGMEAQRKIVALTALHQQELALTRELIHRKQERYSAAISNLIK